MSLVFKPEMFMNESSHMSFYGDMENLSIFCNKIFKDWLESQTVVYGMIGPITDTLVLGKEMAKSDTHKARLVCVEEIKKEPCDHPKSHLVTFSNRPLEARCGICNVDLVFHWVTK